MASHMGLTVGGDLSARPPLLLSARDSTWEQGIGDYAGPSREHQRLLLLCPCQRTVRGVALGPPSVPPQELLAPHILEHPAAVTALCPAPGPSQGVPGEDRGQGGARPGPGEPGAQSVARAASEGEGSGESEVRLWAACADGRVRLWGLRSSRGHTAGYAHGRGGEREGDPMLLEDHETRGTGSGGGGSGGGSLVRGAALHRLWDVGAPIESMVVLRVKREASAPQNQGKHNGGKPLKVVEDIAYLSTWRVARATGHKGPLQEGPIVTGAEKGAQKEGRLMCFSLTRGVPIRFPTALSRVLCRPTPPRLVLSPSGALVACCSGPSVFLWRAEDPFKWLKLQHTRQLTCVAVSPCNCHMAAADISGRVMVWHDVGRERLWGEGNSPSQTQNGPAAQSEGPGGRASGTPGKRGAVVPRQRRAGDFAALISLQHWHSSAVAALCFSADGAYLLSGGAEAVLVLCQLRTGALRFLPRLGGPITGITPLTLASPPTLSAGSGAPAVGAPSLGPGGSAGVGDGRPTVDLGDGALRFSVQCSGVNVVMLVDMAPMSASLLLQGVLMAPVYPGQLPWPAPRPLIRALLPPQLLPPPWVALGAPVVDPLTGLLILPARGARLQFVDVSERSFSAPVAVLQVAPRNAVQQVAPSHQRHSPVPGPHSALQARPGQPAPEPVCVTHIGISPDGLSLFTAEVRMAEGDAPLSAVSAPHPYGAHGSADRARLGHPGMSNTPTLGQGSCLRFWVRTVLPAAEGAPKGGVPQAHQGAAAFSSSSDRSTKGAGGVAGGSAFLLNSRVDNPHGAMGAAVAALAVHPRGALAVTCSSAAPEFKLWCKLQRRSRSDRGLKGTRGAKEGKKGRQAGLGEAGAAEVEVFCWRCKSVGSFQGAASGAPGAAAMSSADFSSDGSLLAVASGSCVTLWDPHSCSLLLVLPDPLPPLPPLLTGGEPPAHPGLHAVTHVKLVGAGPESLVVTASLCASGTVGARSKGGRKGASGGASAEHWLCVRSVLSLEVLWSVRVRVLGLLGGGESGETEWGGMEDCVPEAGLLRPEMPPGCWAALLLLEIGDEWGEQGAEGKAKNCSVARKGGGRGDDGYGAEEEEGKGEGMEEDEEEEEGEGVGEEGDADGVEEEDEKSGEEEEDEEEEEEEDEEEKEEEEEEEGEEEDVNGRGVTPANQREEQKPGGKGQEKRQQEAPPPCPRLLPIVAVFEGANPVPVAAWAVPGEGGAPDGYQQRNQAKQQRRGGGRHDPLAPLALGNLFLLPSMAAPGPLDPEEASEEVSPVARTEHGAGAAAGGGQRALELMVVRGGGEVLHLSPPRSHSLARGEPALYLGGAATIPSIQGKHQGPGNLLEAMFGKQMRESPAGGRKEDESLGVDHPSGMGPVQLGLSLQSMPSHILPSLDKLLPHFLSQLVAGPPPDGSST